MKKIKFAIQKSSSTLSLQAMPNTLCLLCWVSFQMDELPSLHGRDGNTAGDTLQRDQADFGLYQDKGGQHHTGI